VLQSACCAYSPVETARMEWHMLYLLMDPLRKMHPVSLEVRLPTPPNSVR